MVTPHIILNFLQTEWHRVEKGLPAEKLDTKRYNVEKPEPALESDVQVSLRMNVCEECWITDMIFVKMSLR